MISIGFSAPNILASIVNAKDFMVDVSVLKNQKFFWNSKNKIWEKNAVLYNEDLYDVLKIVDDVYFPEEIKNLIVHYEDTLPSELIKSEKIEKIDYSKLIKAPYGPIKGKHPYENFQDEDIRKALSQNRLLFNWTMGAGKSFATSVIYEYLRTYKNVDKMILLTSRIGTYNLQDELVKFCLHLNYDDISVFNSPKSFGKTNRKIFDDKNILNKKVLIFSYDSWKLMDNSYKEEKIPLDLFFGKKDRLLCLDECQYLTNPKSERSKSIMKYLKSFKYRYLFSATPADKNEKLYNICAILDPKLVKYLSYTKWINFYNDVGTYFSKYAINKKGWHEEDLEKLNNNLLQYSVKRNTQDVLDLPKLSLKEFNVEMDEKQRSLYKKVTNNIVNYCVKKGEEVENISNDIIRLAFSTISSFCENPNVLGESDSETVSPEIKELCKKYNYSKNYAKLDVADAIVEDEMEKGERGIIWYLHPKTKDSLIERYKKYNPIVVDSEKSEEERDELIKKFKTDKSHKILIASQNILATSVTLIECNWAIYLETSFSYEIYLQSTGRIYRIGQTRNVRLYHIWLSDSTDLFHKKAIDTKGELINRLFSTGNKLNLSQIKQLFEGEF